MLEKYVNHIFHAYQERYGLDINTDHTFKGFIYNSLTDLHNARSGHNAGEYFYNSPYKGRPMTYDLTLIIYITLNKYNKEKHGIPYPKDTIASILNVVKELKALRLDDNQEGPKNRTFRPRRGRKIKLDEEKLTKKKSVQKQCCHIQKQSILREQNLSMKYITIN